MIGLEFICNVFKKENKQLAEELGISAPNISSWIKGTREIPAKYLLKLSKIFKGISPEYFPKELTYTDELKIRIHHIESMGPEDRFEEYLRTDADDNDRVIEDELYDMYEDELNRLHNQLKKAIQINDYQERVNKLFEKLGALDKKSKMLYFKEKEPAPYISSMLGNYLDFSASFNVKGITVIDSIVNYFVNYHGIEREEWSTQELIPNQNLIDFYKDIEDVFIKHKVI